MSPSATIRDQAERRSSVRHPPVLQVTWANLTRGDRARHFDYGTGTVDGSGLLWILITWDNPDERLNWHTAEIAPYLTRIQP